MARLLELLGHSAYTLDSPGLLGTCLLLPGAFRWENKGTKDEQALH